MMGHKRTEIFFKKLKQIFLLSCALMVVSCRAKSNNNTSVRKGSILKQGEGRKLEILGLKKV